MPLEFRVRWQREERRAKTVIYQDWNSACQKVESIKAMDAIKGQTERWADMPDLVSVELQVREVGEWRDHDYQPEASERVVERVREHLWWQYGEGAPKDRPEPIGEVPF